MSEPVDPRELAKLRNDPFLNSLAVCVCAIRPDWKVASFVTVAAKEHLEGNELTRRPYHEIILAATRKAADPTAQTPKAIWFDGPHWEAAAAEGRSYDPQTGYDTTIPDDPCPDHPEHKAERCGGCRGEWLGGLRPKEYLGLPYRPPMT